jgi:hypothetical protein
MSERYGELHDQDYEIDPDLDPDDREVAKRKRPAPGKVSITSKIPRRKKASTGGLPGDLRDRFETALDTDLSDIRLHHDGSAATRVAEHGARAYALGEDIHFGAGEYDPESPDGQHLIAHEVAHAVQQSGGNASKHPQFKLAASQAHDPVEREADQAADAMLRGTPYTLSAQPTGVAKNEPEERETATVPGVLKTSKFNVTQAGSVTATEAIVTGGAVLAQAPGVNMMGTVSLDPDLDPEPEEIQAGIVQTVTSSYRVAVYQEAGVTVHKNIIGFESVRDAKQGAKAPWYVPPETLSKDKRLVYPLAEDQPKLKFPAKQGNAEVTELQGSDNFLVSLKVGPEGNLHTMETYSWTAPWALRLNGEGRGRGGPVGIGQAHSHPDPKNPGTANEQGNDEANSITTYETVAQAAAALSGGFQSFVTDLPRHKRLDRGSYWNMVTALWQSNAQIKVQLVPIKGGNLDIPLSINSDKSVDHGNVSTKGTYSALAHMVYDPANLGPGHTIYVTVDYQPMAIPFPYAGTTFRDIKVVEEGLWDSDGQVNAIVSIG